MGNERRPSVLVVDDDPEVLRTILRLLRDRATVKVALSADAALLALAGDGFDCVVVDFNMAGPNGAWLLRQVRSRCPGMQRILLSGSSYADLARYLEPGLVDRFLAKPLDIDELIDTVGAPAIDSATAS